MWAMLLTFIPVAVVLTITPGVSTALVVKNAAVDGRRAALLTTVGNEIGVFTWALLAAVGIAALVAASAAAFTTIKLIGAVILIVIGLQSIFGRHSREAPGAGGAPRRRPTSHAFRDGLVTSFANPKLAVFFVALFPQFVPEGSPVLPAALAMATMIVLFDLLWYTALAWVVARARKAFVEGPWMRRAEKLTGTVLVGLGVKLAFEKR
jgi:threonine/homoserine/homoserine lactone efflux protein